MLVYLPRTSVNVPAPSQPYGLALRTPVCLCFYGVNYLVRELALLALSCMQILNGLKYFHVAGS